MKTTSKYVNTHRFEEENKLEKLYCIIIASINAGFNPTKFPIFRKVCVSSAIILTISTGSLLAQPTITSFTPTSGPVGTSVTITGTNFDVTPANNIVFFGAIQAPVSAATATDLTVTVPAGATYMTVTVLVNELIAWSSAPFIVTFDAVAIDANSFALKTDFVTGNIPFSVSIGDLDGDGRADLAVANVVGGSVSVFHNTSTMGTVSYAAKIDFVTGSTPVSVSIGDLDGDGKADLAIVNQNDNLVSVLRNTSTSGVIDATSFATIVDFITGLSPQSVSIGDLDGDGKADLAVSNGGSNSVSVFRNTGTSGVIDATSFATKIDFDTGIQPQSVSISDLDGDGKADLVVTNLTSNTVSVIKNTSTSGVIDAASFAAKVDFNTGVNPYSVSIGDLDGDGKTDLVVSNGSSNTVSVLRNTSIGGVIDAASFATKVDFITGSSPQSVSIGDLDGDGKTDLAVANQNSSTVSVLRNTSTSGVIDANSFAAKIDFTTGSSPQSVTIGDLDGDGKADLSVANLNSNTVSILRHTITDTEITAFSFVEQTEAATIDAMNYTVDIGVALSTDVTNLVAAFSLSPGATASVNATTQTSTSTVNDFTSPVIYTVTAEDGVTTQDWIVTVTITTFNKITFDDQSFMDEQGLGMSFTISNNGQSFDVTTTINNFTYQNPGNCYSTSGFISDDTGISIQTSDNAIVDFASLDLIFDEACSSGNIEGFLLQAFKNGVQVGTDQIVPETADVIRTMNLSPDFQCIDQVQIFSTSGNGFQIGIGGVVWKQQVAPVTSDEIFTVNELGVNEEAGPFDILIGTVTGVGNGGLTFSITSGNTGSVFAIDQFTGEISVFDVIAFNFEATPSYTLTVDVSDGCQTSTAIITINLNDLSPNDFCTGAVTIGVGDTVSGSTLDATGDAAIAPNCGSNVVNDGSLGVWYLLVGTGEKITLSTCNDANYDTSIGVYAGSCISGLTCVAGNDDGDGCLGFTSQTSFISVQDQDYYILIDGFQGQVGNFNLTTSGEPAPILPANDNCGQAETLTVFAEGTGTATEGDNTNATNFTGIVSCDRYGTINDVWYTFNSGPNVEVLVTITLTDTDGAGPSVAAGPVQYEVYQNCGDIEMDICGSSDLTELFAVTPNTDYRLQLWNTPNDEGTFTILVNDGPNTSATVSTSTVSMSRYSLNGDIVETVTASDNEGHNQVFTITAGNVEGIFDIDGNSGEITVVDEAALLASATTTFALTAQAADLGPGALTSTGMITIIIVDNEFPLIADQTIAIDENSANATSVVNVNATDADMDNLTYAIISGNTGNAFAIDAAGEITVLDQAQLDFEQAPVFMLLVEVTDDGPLTLSSTATITINLNDVNEAPGATTATFDISQNNSNGYIIGSVDFTDQDVGQNHTYSITAGNTNTIFAIDSSTGELSIANETDLLANGASSYPLTIEVSDDGAPMAMGSATVTVDVFNNNPPVITPVAFTLDENTVNTTAVGTVIATDPEIDGITFSIASGNDLGGFLITPAGEVQIADMTQLDFETNPFFNLEIEAQDDNAGGMLSATEFVVIDLTDVNEAPSISNFDFDVNISFASPNGSLVKQVLATDPENDVITYSIFGGNGSNIFGIDPATGKISIVDGSLLNPATTPVHTLTIDVEDGSLSGSGTLTINVYGNDAPTLDATSFNIDENSANGTLIATLTSSDTDGIALFEIISGNDLGQFALDGTTGDLSVNDATSFNAETNQQFDIEIRMTDNGLGNIQNTETVSVVINDVTAPVADVATLADVTGECSVTISTAPTATDNRSGVISGIADTTFPITAQGTTMVAWTYDDGNGNTSTQTQNVVIDDVTAPVADAATLADLTGECSVTMPAAPTATDNCSGVITGTADTTFPITAQGTIMVTWTYTDDEGNTGTQTQNVVIDDVTSPDADMATLTDVTADCLVTSLTAPMATDNCSGTITGTHDATLPIVAQGTTVLTWTYADDEGNESTQTQNVVIDDVTNPVADETTLVDVTADCSLESLAAPAATDNCTGTIAGTTDTTFPITTQGTTVVIWTFDDGNGNTSSQTQNVVINCITTGIEDGLKDFKIYPNPVKGTFQLSQLSGEIDEVTIFGMNGMVIKRSRKDDGSFDIQDLQVGIYIVQVAVDGKIQSLRLVKE